MAHITTSGNKHHVFHNARLIGTFDSTDEAKEFIKNRNNPNIYQERVEAAKEKAAESVKVAAPKKAAKKKAVSKKK